MPFRVPFNRPFVVGDELTNIAEAVRSGQLAGVGAFTRRCESFLQDRFGIHRVLMTSSCTAALEMSALLLDLRPGDEVIMPAFTFVSTANAFVRAGARPVFVDVRPDTLNLDETRVEVSVTDRTRVIVPVHYGGIACQMDAIGEIARRHNLTVIEDAAQASMRLRTSPTMPDLGLSVPRYEFLNFLEIELGRPASYRVPR